MKRFVAMLGSVVGFVLKVRGQSSLSLRGRVGTMLLVCGFNLVCLALNRFIASMQHQAPPIPMSKVYHHAMFSGNAKT